MFDPKVKLTPKNELKLFKLLVFLCKSEPKNQGHLRKIKEDIDNYDQSVLLFNIKEAKEA